MGQICELYFVGYRSLYASCWQLCPLRCVGVCAPLAGHPSEPSSGTWGVLWTRKMHSFRGFTTKCLLRGDLRVTLSEAALEENVMQIARSDLGSCSPRQRLRQSGLITWTRSLNMEKWPPERQNHMLVGCCWYGKECDRHIYWHNAPWVEGPQGALTEPGKPWAEWGFWQRFSR